MNYPNQQTDASGVFTVPVGTLPFGTYTWWVKGPQFLASSGAVDLNGALTTTQGMGLQRAGDVNNDNFCDILDLDLLLGAFDSISTSVNWDAAADCNCDGAIDILDLDLLLGNFDMEGAL